MRPAFITADAVGEREGLVLVVGDEDGRRARRSEDSLHLVAHLGAQLGVEVRERLVEQEERGRRRQRASEGDPLLLTAGELVRDSARRSRASPTISRRGRTRSRLGRGPDPKPEATLSATVRWGKSA